MQILIEGLSANSSIEILELSSNFLQIESAQRLAEYITRPYANSLVSLICDDNYFDNNSMKAFSTKFSEFSTYSNLEHIDFSLNSIGDEGVQTLLNSLNGPSNIKSIHLNSVGMEIASFHAFMSFIEVSQSIETVEINGNDIFAFEDVIPESNSTEIHRWNFEIEEKICAIIEHHPNLVAFSIENCGIPDNVIERINNILLNRKFQVEKQKRKFRAQWRSQQYY
jgi:Ran GTPase-activating protein (RanGAP) involved in mRNA processing and transport